ncbi:MAG: cytoplasmic protein [Desulfobacteraceae bacterium]|nr:cytoplasmic protein [Desulfobacteraceae bacterium]
MVGPGSVNNEIDFAVEKNNLYREEGYTDMKVASIRRLIPVTPDGEPDKNRTELFVGSTQIMTPQGPIPLQSMLPANNFTEALNAFPGAMEKAMGEMLEEFKKMQEKEQHKDDSRIIVPGR